ncbi:MAG: dienelactone hydrolase family protein [Burkholderiales bacterium]
MRILADATLLDGILRVPSRARGIVLFAHGSGSSRHSPRNQFVANALHETGIATLLMDLLTPDEDRDYARRFDIGLLTQRLVATMRWVQRHAATARMQIGLFGASTGAAAALQAAALEGHTVVAVVSRGGRPDLAGDPALRGVVSPTLLIVGGLDHVVIDLNQAAYGLLQCKKRFDIVPGATHLFEEPGTLEEVARLARLWFVEYLE